MGDDSQIRKLHRPYVVPETGFVYADGDLAFLSGQGPQYIGPPDPGIASVRDESKELMGVWLGKLVPWDYFSTWTFSRPVSVDGALYMGRRHLAWMEKQAGIPIYSFLATEKGKTGGLVHIHALTGNVAHLKAYCGTRLPPGKWNVPCCLLHAWPAGHARILPYDPAKGAKHYVSKYVLKAIAEWELSGFPASPQGVLRKI